MNEPPANIPPLPLRRLLISEAGTAPEPTKPPQEIEDRKGETKRIVNRLMAIIEDHRTSALRLGIRLDAVLLEIVLRALEAETRREDPAPILAQGDEIRTYAATALYEELLEEPSNILFTTQVNPDVIRYEAMEAAFWVECLAALRQKIIPSA